MNIFTRTVAFIAVATGLVACSSKPSDTAASTGAGSASGATAGAPAAVGGDFHSVLIYPGMVELTSANIPAGEGMTLHTGDFRSTDSQEKILAFYREALTKQFGAVADMPGTAQEGMVRIAAGNEKDKMVTIIVHPGDSGGQIVGIQVAAKD
jgi:hypothetical protein